MIQLAVLDEQTMFLHGIRYAFDGNHCIHVVGESHNDVSLFEIIAQAPVDVILLCVNTPKDISYTNIVRYIHHDYPTVKILVVANEDTDQIVHSLMQTGINGYISKRQANCQELEKAIHIVAAGGIYIG